MFTIRIADINVRIINTEYGVDVICKDYITDSNVFDFSISVSEMEIQAEHEKNNVCIAGCECSLIYRKLCMEILRYDAFLMHASVVAVDNQAYAFAAKSGTGKTTHTELWRKHFGDRSVIVNGDKPILRYMNGTLMAYGTPWCGKEQQHTNTSIPLKAICFLEQDAKNSIRRMENSEITDRLFHQVLIPEDIDSINLLFNMLNTMVNTIPCYLLKCNISENAVLTAYNGMNKKIQA